MSYLSIVGRVSTSALSNTVTGTSLCGGRSVCGSSKFSCRPEKRLVTWGKRGCHTPRKTHSYILGEKRTAEVIRAVQRDGEDFKGLSSNTGEELKENETHEERISKLETQLAALQQGVATKKDLHDHKEELMKFVTNALAKLVEEIKEVIRKAFEKQNIESTKETVLLGVLQLGVGFLILVFWAARILGPALGILFRAKQKDDAPHLQTYDV